MATPRSRPESAKVTVAAPAASSAPAYIVSGVGDEEYAAAYRYGVLVADQHGKKTFAEVEPMVSEQWITARGTSRLTWDEARPAVQQGYAGVVRVQPAKEAERPAKAHAGRGKARAAKRGTTKTSRARTSAKTSRTTSRGRSHGDDRAKRGPQDRSRISLSEPYEMNYWCERLGVTPAELKRAVKSAGPSVTKVRRELGK